MDEVRSSHDHAADERWTAEMAWGAAAPHQGNASGCPVVMMVTALADDPGVFSPVARRPWWGRHLRPAGAGRASRPCHALALVDDQRSSRPVHACFAYRVPVGTLSGCIIGHGWTGMAVSRHL